MSDNKSRSIESFNTSGAIVPAKHLVFIIYFNYFTYLIYAVINLLV